MAIDRLNIIQSARQGLRVEIKTHTLNHETEIDLEEILTLFLEELDQIQFKDFLSFCLKELTTNSKKANTKRVYFVEKKLNLENPTDYQKGMRTFKTETLENIGHYLTLLEKADLYIVVTFQIIDSVLHLKIRNNTPISKTELSRVREKIDSARVFKTMEEAFSVVLDETEGAGLGIIIMVQMLRKMGLSEKAFAINAVGNETVAGLTVPMSIAKKEKISALGDEIVEIIETLPPFPENISKLQLLLQSPQVTMNAIAAQLALDPVLTAELLKFVNSAFLGVTRKVKTIGEAVQLIGINRLNSILLPFASQQLLAKFILKHRSLWEDAIKVSNYATELAKHLGFSKQTQDEVQVGGLLFNIGQIVFSFVYPEVSERVLAFCKSKEIPRELFDSISEGLNQGELGARIARKWNFPSNLVAMIEFSRYPQSAPEQQRGIVALIYIASSIVLIEKGLLIYSQLNQPALKAFKIATQEDLLQIQERLRRARSTI